MNPKTGRWEKWWTRTPGPIPRGFATEGTLCKRSCFEQPIHKRMAATFHTARNLEWISTTHISLLTYFLKERVADAVQWLLYGTTQCLKYATSLEVMRPI